MSKKKIVTHRHLRALVPLSLLVVVASFSAGMRTSGSIQTIEWSSATDAMRGDMTSDGTVDIDDVIVLLEIAQGYRQPTPDELAADPNADGRIGVDDAIRVLRTLSPRS